MPTPSSPPYVPQITRYSDWLATEHGLRFDDFPALWRWSVADLEAFWRSIWDYHQLSSPTPFEKALNREVMPGALWFQGAQVNYVDQVFRHVEPAEAAGQPAIVADNEQGEVREIRWPDLRRDVAAFAATLEALGVEPGDRVCAYMPNRPETVVAFLACAAIGAVWSLCAPDMGAPAVRDRFRQVEPKVLIAVDGVYYAGRALDRSEVVQGLRDVLPSVETVVVLQTPFAARRLERTVSFAEALQRPADGAAFKPRSLPFDHPLWILYSSGTTGLPKPLVHSHGGVLVTAQANAKHTDLGQL